MSKKWLEADPTEMHVDVNLIMKLFGPLMIPPQVNNQCMSRSTAFMTRDSY